MLLKVLQLKVEAFVLAPAQLIYEIVADYRKGHPNILPKGYFSALEVEQGGTGAGTIICFKMHMFGLTRSFRVTITEPEPGRVLSETDSSSGTETTFTISPLEGSQLTKVTITTRMTTRGGIFGPLERFLTSRTLQTIYNQELQLLATLAESLSASPATEISDHSS